ncbi:flagellar basal-body rod protein FlgF [Terrarubrum flagellatum]|uniref:flagellar basal-body rod protein FlgF n=1 Tax=Terrirubrum flagellatum TaxID=2895980 RepID=UPI003144EE28
MENALLIGLSRQMALAREADVIANNVANVNTNGFKARSQRFEEYLMPVAKADSFPGAGQRLSYVLDGGVGLDVTQGAIERTGNPLDLAIQGDAFFTVQTPAGERYTRDGAFTLNSAGELVNASGFKVVGDGGVITFSPQDGDIEIGADGVINTKQGPRGQIKLVSFDNSRLLTSEGDNLFSSTAPSRPVGKDVKVSAGSVERSNVKPILAMSRLMEVTRAYQNITNMIQRTDELRGSAIQKLADMPS